MIRWLYTSSHSVQNVRAPLLGANMMYTLICQQKYSVHKSSTNGVVLVANYGQTYACLNDYWTATVGKKRNSPSVVAMVHLSLMSVGSLRHAQALLFVRSGLHDHVSRDSWSRLLSKLACMAHATGNEGAPSKLRASLNTCLQTHGTLGLHCIHIWVTSPSVKMSFMDS